MIVTASFLEEGNRTRGTVANPAITDSFVRSVQSVAKLNPTILHGNSTKLIIGINISLDHNLSRLIPSRTVIERQREYAPRYRFSISNLQSVVRELNTNELRKIVYPILRIIF